MDRAALRVALERRGVRGDAYDIGDEHPVASEAYVLRPAAGSAWAVWYSERGLETGRRGFATEDEACRFFLRWIGGDASACPTP